MITVETIWDFCWVPFRWRSRSGLPSGYCGSHVVVVANIGWFIEINWQIIAMSKHLMANDGKYNISCFSVKLTEIRHLGNPIGFIYLYLLMGGSAKLRKSKELDRFWTKFLRSKQQIPEASEAPKGIEGPCPPRLEERSSSLHLQLDELTRQAGETCFGGFCGETNIKSHKDPHVTFQNHCCCVVMIPFSIQNHPKFSKIIQNHYCYIVARCCKIVTIYNPIAID